MTPEDETRLRELLTGERQLALGVVVDLLPVVGLLPYALASDFSALYVQASRIAHHSQGLKAGARWSGVIHARDAPEADPLQIPRLVLQGSVEPLPGDASAFASAARALLSRFPGAARTLALPDFGLYRLEIDGGRLVLGFGHAVNLGVQQLRSLAEGTP